MVGEYSFLGYFLYLFLVVILFLSLLLLFLLPFLLPFIAILENIDVITFFVITKVLIMTFSPHVTKTSFPVFFLLKIFKEFKKLPPKNTNPTLVFLQVCGA